MWHFPDTHSIAPPMSASPCAKPLSTSQLTLLLFQERGKVSERFAPLLLEAVESMVMSPENCTKGVFSMSHKELLLFCGGKRASVSVEEGKDQIRATDPRPIWISAEISNAHIPMGKLEVYDTCPGSFLADEPIGGAIVSMTGKRTFAFKRWYQVVSRLDGSQFIIIDVSSMNCTFYLAFGPLGNVFPGILRKRLDTCSIA